MAVEAEVRDAADVAVVAKGGADGVGGADGADGNGEFADYAPPPVTDRNVMEVIEHGNRRILAAQGVAVIDLSKMGDSDSTGICALLEWIATAKKKSAAAADGDKTVTADTPPTGRSDKGDKVEDGGNKAKDNNIAKADAKVGDGEGNVDGGGGSNKVGGVGGDSNVGKGDSRSDGGDGAGSEGGGDSRGEGEGGILFRNLQPRQTKMLSLYELTSLITPYCR